ncbi:MAG: hypothetical protein B0A82_08900, partial [Alkalinema sp. CACIAM 70d]
NHLLELGAGRNVSMVGRIDRGIRSSNLVTSGRIGWGMAQFLDELVRRSSEELQAKNIGRWASSKPAT